MKNTAIFAVLFLTGALASVSAQSLVIYGEDDPPFQQSDKDGKLSGFVIETVQEIQKRVGNTDKISIVPWARGYQEIQAKDNVVLFSMTRNLAREPLFNWVGPIHETVFGFYAKADSALKIASLEDAKKVKAIGVYKDDIRDQYLTSQGFKNLDRVAENETNVKKLAAGRVDLYASSRTAIKGETEGAGFKVADFKEVFPFLSSQVYIAMSKKVPGATVKAWNDALDAMKKDGTFEKIYHKYLPANALPGPAVVPKQ